MIRPASVQALTAGLPLPGLVATYAAKGDSASARRELTRLIEFVKRAHVPSEQVAQAYIAVGDRDTAIQWLQRAFDERSVGALWLPMLAVYDPLRRDPRFAVLVQRIAASRP